MTQFLIFLQYLVKQFKTLGFQINPFVFPLQYDTLFHMSESLTVYILKVRFFQLLGKIS